MAPSDQSEMETPCPRAKAGTRRQVALGCTFRSREGVVPPSSGPSVSPRVKAVLLAELTLYFLQWTVLLMSQIYICGKGQSS